jgi:DNA-binding transcriptional MerR regulator
MAFSVEIQSGGEVPLYNIGVVSRMTGISMATLRAWERRYDFPESQRTVGGHRLYTERDIIRLRWVKQRIDAGMQTSQAIRALQHQEKTGQPVLTEEAFSTQPYSRSGPLYPSEALEQDDNRSYFAGLRERLIQALTRRVPQDADDLLSEALALISPEVLILRVIQPVMDEIGDLWEQNKISVATEHLATNYLRQRLLHWMVSAPPPRSQQSIVLACAPNEWHEGSLLILGALLRRRLWPVVYLGQAVPLPDLASFVREANPPLVVLVAMTEETASNLIDWTNWMQDVASKGRPVVGFGGRIFVEKPEWRMKVPGIYLGSNFEEGILTIEKLLR